MILLDGGARAEELLNVRLKDLTKEKLNNDRTCYWINIRYSKKEPRKIPLPLSCKFISEWLAEHPKVNDSESQVIPFSYGRMASKISILAEKVLKKRVTLHMLRHCSATYWAPKMNCYQLCAKYGWSFSSDMPDRYIERKGIIFDRIAEKGDVDQVSMIQRENRELLEKVERLEREYGKIRKALEFIMPIIENMERENFRRAAFESRKRKMMISDV